MVGGLPAADPADIQVHEIRTGIVTDAATLQIQSGLLQLQGIESRQAYVNGLPQHVVAALGNAAAAPGQHIVGLG